MESKTSVSRRPIVLGIILALLLSGFLALATAPDAYADSDAWANYTAKKTSITVGKNYSRDCSKYLIHQFKFTSKGGTYILKVNDKIGKKGYLDICVWLGKKLSAKTKFVIGYAECIKGSNTFNLGKIKKGAIVNIQFTNGHKSKSDKFSFKVVRK